MTIDHGDDARWRRSDLWSLREDVQVELEGGGSLLRIRSRWGNITIQRPSQPVREALYRMRLGPVSLDNVTNAQSRQEPRDGAGSPGQAGRRRYPSARIQLDQVLDQLQPLIIRSLGLETGQPLLSVVPMTPRSRFRVVPLPPDMPVRLSAYAELHTNGKEYCLQSPLSLHRVVLHRVEAVWLLGSLGRPVNPAEYADALPQLGSVAADTLAYLAAAGMVVQAEGTRGRDDSDQPVFSEDTDPALTAWTPVDLMFHTRRTLGRHDNAFGATYPMGLPGPPEPVVKPRLAGPSIALHRPSWENLVATDPALAVAMEGRRSMRVYGSRPVTATELGDLLYRTARVRFLISPPPAGEPSPHPGGPSVVNGLPRATGGYVAAVDPRLSDRPYPGGGACYELELYVTVGQCQGIASAVYHYEPLGHSLELVNSDRAVVDELLISASQAAVAEVPPPVLITMTARFRRLTWKYEGMAYAVALMDVGVLIQNLYLVCTAMDLAPCALGSVRIDATASAFGTDWRLEPSVGQFMLGRYPDNLGEYVGRWDPVNDANWSDLARAKLRGPGASPL